MGLISQERIQIVKAECLSYYGGVIFENTPSMSERTSYPECMDPFIGGFYNTDNIGT
jgi:hypothetical protein